MFAFAGAPLHLELFLLLGRSDSSNGRQLDFFLSGWFVTAGHVFLEDFQLIECSGAAFSWTAVHGNSNGDDNNDGKMVIMDQKRLALPGRRLVRLEVGRLLAEVMRFLTPLS